MFALSRAVFVMVLLATRLALPDQVEGSFLELLCRWDCSHYLGIASDGYSIDSNVGNADSTNYAFFPLFPLLLGVLSATTTLSPLAAGIVLSNALFTVALVYVYYYAREARFSHRVGMTAVTILSFAPPSIVFSAPMTESLFLLLLAAAVLHMRRGDYLASGIAAGLLSATRPNGIAFVFFALTWLIRSYGWKSFVRPWHQPLAYLPVVLAPLGLFAYWGFSFATTGDAFAHATTNRHGWMWGGVGPIEMLAVLPRLDASDLFLIATGVLAFGVSLLLLRYRLYAEFALVLASFAFYWSGGLAPWSMPRFALVLFPLAVVLGRFLERRPGATGAALAVAGTVNGLFLVVGWALELFVV